MSNHAVNCQRKDPNIEQSDRKTPERFWNSFAVQTVIGNIGQIGRQGKPKAGSNPEADKARQLQLIFG